MNRYTRIFLTLLLFAQTPFSAVSMMEDGARSGPASDVGASLGSRLVHFLSAESQEPLLHDMVSRWYSPDDAPDFGLILQNQKLTDFPFITPVLELQSDDHASTIASLGSMLSTADNDITSADAKSIFDHTLQIVQWLRPSFANLQATTREDQITLVKAFLCANSDVMHCVQRGEAGVDSDGFPQFHMKCWAPIWQDQLFLSCGYCPSEDEDRALFQAFYPIELRQIMPANREIITKYLTMSQAQIHGPVDRIISIGALNQSICLYLAKLVNDPTCSRAWIAGNVYKSLFPGKTLKITEASTDELLENIGADINRFHQQFCKDASKELMSLQSFFDTLLDLQGKMRDMGCNNACETLTKFQGTLLPLIGPYDTEIGGVGSFRATFRGLVADAHDNLQALREKIRNPSVQVQVRRTPGVDDSATVHMLRGVTVDGISLIPGMVKAFKVLSEEIGTVYWNKKHESRAGTIDKDFERIIQNAIESQDLLIPWVLRNDAIPLYLSNLASHASKAQQMNRLFTKAMQKVNAVTAQHLAAVDDIETAKKEKGALRQQIADLKSGTTDQRKAHEAAKKAAKKEIAALQKEIEEKAAEVATQTSALEAELALKTEKAAEIAELTSNIETLQAAIKAAESTHEQALAEQLSGFEQRKAQEVEVQVQSLIDARVAAEKKSLIAATQRAAKAGQDSKGKIDTLQVAVKQRVDEITRLKAGHAKEKKARAAETESQREQVEQQLATITGLNARISALLEENAKDALALIESQEAAAQAKVLKTQYDQLQTDHNALQDAARRLEQENTERGRLSSALTTLLQAENRELKSTPPIRVLPQDIFLKMGDARLVPASLLSAIDDQGRVVYSTGVMPAQPEIQVRMGGGHTAIATIVPGSMGTGQMMFEIPVVPAMETIQLITADGKTVPATVMQGQVGMYVTSLHAMPPAPVLPATIMVQSADGMAAVAALDPVTGGYKTAAYMSHEPIQYAPKAEQ